MKRILLAALLVSLPALAQEYPGDDDFSWQMQEPPPPDYDQPPPPTDYDQPPQPARRGPTLDDFRGDRELSWSGEWLDTPEYGTVWRPTSVDSDWRPYLYGHWEWTTVGWAWASDEPFGWAVYHYGRWAYVGSWGWIWVPGRVWAPAWVAWRWGNGYAGWCPLGPQLVVWEQPQLWVFVSANHFLDPVPRYVVPRTELPVLYARARALPVQPGPRAGPIAGSVARATGHSLRPMPIRDASSPRAAVGGAGVWYYRPRTAPLAAPVGTPRPHAQVTPGGGQRFYGGAPSPVVRGGPSPAVRSGEAPRAVPAPHATPTKPAAQAESGSEQKPHAR